MTVATATMNTGRKVQSTAQAVVKNVGHAGHVVSAPAADAGAKVYEFTKRAAKFALSVAFWMVLYMGIMSLMAALGMPALFGYALWVYLMVVLPTYVIQ